MCFEEKTAIARAASPASVSRLTASPSGRNHRHFRENGDLFDLSRASWSTTPAHEQHK
jgi:hypothetical protein